MFETKTAALSAVGVAAPSASPLGAQESAALDKDDDGYPSREETQG